MRLKDILPTVREAQGVGRLVAMQRLRYYLAAQNMLVVCDEVKTITDPKDLNLIIGAGAPGHIYYAVLAQKAYLAGVV